MGNTDRTLGLNPNVSSSCPLLRMQIARTGDLVVVAREWFDFRLPTTDRFPVFLAWQGEASPTGIDGHGIRVPVESAVVA